MFLECGVPLDWTNKMKSFHPPKLLKSIEITLIKNNSQRTSDWNHSSTSWVSGGFVDRIQNLDKMFCTIVVKTWACFKLWWSIEKLLATILANYMINNLPTSPIYIFNDDNWVLISWITSYIRIFSHFTICFKGLKFNDEKLICKYRKKSSSSSHFDSFSKFSESNINHWSGIFL